MNMKKVILLAGLFLIGLTAYGQSDQQGFSISAWGGPVLGDSDFSEVYGFAIGGNAHYTITDSESTNFAVSFGAFSISPKSEFKDLGAESELFLRAYGNVIFSDALAENQNISLGLGYAWVADSDVDYGGLYFEAFYHFELSDSFSIAPGALYVAGGDEDGSIFIGSIRATFKF